MPPKDRASPVLERLAIEQQRVADLKAKILAEYAKDSKPPQKGREVELFMKEVHEDGMHAYTKDCVRRCINYLLNFNYLNLGKEGRAMCFLEDLFPTKTQHLRQTACELAPASTSGVGTGSHLYMAFFHLLKLFTTNAQRRMTDIAISRFAADCDVGTRWILTNLAYVQASL